jgi:MFS family permease
LIGFFLSNLDVTIVSSSLTNITDSLDGFEKRSWIITGYLATYTGINPACNFIEDVAQLFSAHQIDGTDLLVLIS